MIRVYDTVDDRLLGELTEPQLQLLVDRLEEESREDRDYYISRDMLDAFEEENADVGLVAFLRRALGSREDMEIRWERA